MTALVARVCVLPAKTAFFVLFALLVNVGGCGRGEVSSRVAPVETGNLEAGAAARVGRELIMANGVARIAAAQKIDVAVARDLAIRDALFTAEAKARGVDAEPDIALLTNAVLARRMLHKLLNDAERAGPATDEELERVTKRRWLEFDRPEGFRVVHAVVRIDKEADAQKRDRARVVARAVREAVMPVAEAAKTTARPLVSGPLDEVVDPVVDMFRRAVDAVPHDGFEITVEGLPPIAADGRMLRPEGGDVEAAFADGASKLDARGALSEIVSTSYGSHVVLLLERIVEARLPTEERRGRVSQEVIWGRAGAARAKLVEGLRRDVAVERGVDALLVMVPVDR